MEVDGELRGKELIGMIISLLLLLLNDLHEVPPLYCFLYVDTDAFLEKPLCPILSSDPYIP